MRRIDTSFGIVLVRARAEDQQLLDRQIYQAADPRHLRHAFDLSVFVEEPLKDSILPADRHAPPADKTIIIFALRKLVAGTFCVHAWIAAHAALVDDLVRREPVCQHRQVLVDQIFPTMAHVVHAGLDEIGGFLRLGRRRLVLFRARGNNPPFHLPHR